MEGFLPFGRWSSISYLSSACVEFGRFEAIVQLLVRLPGVSRSSVASRASRLAWWWSSASVESRVVGGIVVCILWSKVGILNRDGVDFAMSNRKSKFGDSATNRKCTPPVLLCFRIKMASLIEAWAVGSCNVIGLSRLAEALYCDHVPVAKLCVSVWWS